MRVKRENIVGSKITVDTEYHSEDKAYQTHLIKSALLNNWLEEIRKKDIIKTYESQKTKVYEIEVAVLTLAETQEINMYIKELEDKIKRYESGTEYTE